MPEYENPFADTIRQFLDAGVRFVVVGGVAMGLHGSAYATTDIDFAYAVDPDNVVALAAFLSVIHARILGRPHGDGFVIMPERLLHVKFLNLVTDLGQVDILRELQGVDSYEGLLSRTVPIDLGGFTVPVASIDDLLAMKRAANRPKDQNHIYELLALKKIQDSERA